MKPYTKVVASISPIPTIGKMIKIIWENFKLEVNKLINW